MRKLFIISAIVFAVLGIAFIILPFGMMALLPIGLTLILSFLAIQKSKPNQKKLPKIILFISALMLLVAIGKVVFIKDVAVSGMQSGLKKEDIKDLEGLQN